MSASFDSWKRKAATPCLPGTRGVLLDRIYEWGDSRDDRAVFWLHGPAGSGKTSIATTVAEKYAKENRLAGSFFFSRDQADCRSVDRVIATIAYQHATSRRVIKKRVQKVLGDRSIIEKLPIVQFEKLILDPVRPRTVDECVFGIVENAFKLQSAFFLWTGFPRIQIRPLRLIIDHPHTHPLCLILRNDFWLFRICCFATLVACIASHPFISRSALFIVLAILVVTPIIQNIVQASLELFFLPPGPPMIVVIDALDESIINSVSIDHLIEIITHEYRDSPPPIRFLLTSRPEENIRATFRLHPERTFFNDLLDFEAYDDIQRFFKKEFKDLNIRLSDYLMNVKKPWPSPEDIESLVKKSEGLFIYASTLVKFVGEMEPKDPIPPIQKLDYEVPILPADKLKSAMTQHNGLDGLYLQVLRDAPYSANPDFMHIFGALCLMPTQSSMTNLAMFLRLKDSDYLRQLLRGCKSILRIPESNSETIAFFHASLHDFLTNKDRSLHFYVDPIAQHLSLLDDCFQDFYHIERNLYGWNLHGFYITGYSWNNWHNHLLALHNMCKRGQCGKLVDLLKGFFKERYETVFLSGLHRFHDSNGQWPLAWGQIFVNSFEENLETLRRQLLVLEVAIEVCIPFLSFCDKH